MNRDVANQLITLAVIKKMLIGIDADVRERAGFILEPGDRVTGKANGVPIGAVQMRKATSSWRVVNGAQFRAWVKDTRPEEIQTVEAVNGAFERAVLAKLEELGGWPDEKSGEMSDVPGVTRVEGTPTLAVTTVKDAQTHIEAELAATGLTVSQFLASLSAPQIEAS